ncbi:MAG: YbdK family carboxylate-amine ligase [Solirubrobacteraceae bacterium]|nr:YbdK family carboxylate-amine ligase [Solirubrobacteraceae bacterium]
MGTEVTHTQSWAQWPVRPDAPAWTIGVEEEVMLVAAPGYNLAQAVDEVMPRLPIDLASRVHRETHAAAVELATEVHTTVDSAVDDLRNLRRAMRQTCDPLELQVASSGTHPFAVSREISVTRGERQAAVYGSMRELARREPTFALHVHVGFHDPEAAIKVFNRMRVHIPMLLALSANSPFWQGRDTGLASSRTPLFQAFPRVGIPRRFESFQEWVDTVDMLVTCEAFPDPTFLWWDVRVQPRVGTIEVRIMDAQVTLDATAALVALVQSLAKMEHEEAWAEEASRSAVEVHDENRFLAARDGVEVALIDPVQRRRVPLRERLDTLLPLLRPHAQDLGCIDALESVNDLFDTPGAGYQLRVARRAERLPGLVRQLCAEF